MVLLGGAKGDTMSAEVGTFRVDVEIERRKTWHFRQVLGEDVAKELVEWFNQVDATYRSDLRELNELNFARFDAKLEQRVIQFDARIRPPGQRAQCHNRPGGERTRCEDRPRGEGRRGPPGHLDEYFPDPDPIQVDSTTG
jgi:hypothetical protein